MRDGIDAAGLVWLPAMRRGAYRADPFGLWRDGRLHVFAEAFDYRTRVGHIELLIYDADLTLFDCRTVLRARWHLSYPVVFEAEGQIWMLPEAYRSGTLTLYRACPFPFRWQPVCRIALDGPAIDATPLFHAGKWWLFYAPSRNAASRRSHLHVAWSRALTGPWQLHPGNPVRIDLAGARPGGTARLQDGAIVLPVQDCRSSYGAALRELSISRLDQTGFTATLGAGLSAPAALAPFTDGLHTLSAAGPVSLIDVKRIDASAQARALRLGGIMLAQLKSAGRRAG